MSELLNSTRLLFDLHQGSEIAKNFSGLEPEAIARQLTDGLVTKFDIALARIWLLEPDRQSLKLVSSSGMYTHINGSFSRVPLGAYKVGKIAQNRVSFLSNNLAEESWVGDRDWAIANDIRGFAGFPLIARGKVLGVLANFSKQAMEPEFLEILQTLCTMASIALDGALQYQEERQTWLASSLLPSFGDISLSDRLANILSSTRLTLVGAEKSLTLPLVYIFLQAAEILNGVRCAYCRLIYSTDSVELEAIVPATDVAVPDRENWIRSAFGELSFIISCLGGGLSIETQDSQHGIRVALKLPYPSGTFGQSQQIQLRIQCKFSVLQTAFTHLAYLAGLTVGNGSSSSSDRIPLLTDDITKIPTAKRVLWIEHQTMPIALPKGIQAKIDLGISPAQLQDAVDAVARGESWGLESGKEALPLLSDRELEMMRLLAQGLRDRDISKHLVISESTVKFHVNNILTKLKAKTRFQALHQAIVNGWL